MLQYLEKIRNFLSGKKTYTIAVGSIIASIISWLVKDINYYQMIEQIVPLILAMTIRSGIITEINKNNVMTVKLEDPNEEKEIIEIKISE